MRKKVQCTLFISFFMGIFLFSLPKKSPSENPDLVVSLIRMTNECFIEMQLENQGSDITAKSFRKKKKGIWLEIYQNKELWGRLNLVDIDLEGELNKGGGHLTYFWNPLGTPEYRQVERDTFTIAAYIDSDKNLKESDEKNNKIKNTASCSEFLGLSPCVIRLDSLAYKVNNKSGQLIILRGKFGPTQGEKYICIKRPRTRKREQSLFRVKIVSWTDTEIISEFPATLKEIAIVGIFCSNVSPFHSGWKTIMIRNIKGTGYKRSEAKNLFKSK